MTELLLIRHGETDWNTERRLQGHTDIPLNNEGVRQARALGLALRRESLDAIVSSDLQRAMQTAQAIADVRDMPIQVDTGLRERCYGAFEGLRHVDISERYPEDYLAWQSREWDARFPQGLRTAETLREFTERAVGSLTRLVKSRQARRIAVVTHGGVLECIYRAAKGIASSAPRDFEIRNASINRLTWSGAAFQVVQWSDVAHLTHAALDEVDK